MFTVYLGLKDPLINESIMVFFLQQSTFACLLKGTGKGIHSLLEESLIVTQEMLREAQLAYPRSPVRDPIFAPYLKS